MNNLILTSISTSPAHSGLSHELITLNFKGDRGLNVSIDLTAAKDNHVLHRKLRAALMMREIGLTWENIGTIIEVAS